MSPQRPGRWRITSGYDPLLDMFLVCVVLICVVACIYIIVTAAAR